MDEHKSVLPNDFNFPEGLYRIINQNLTNIEPWYILNPNQIEKRMEGLKRRYPERSLIPFAKRGDNDDIACFEYKKGEVVYIIHDFASAGWEEHGQYNTFWDWFRAAIEEMINFN